MIQLGAGQEHTVPLFDKKGKHTGELKFKAQEEQGGSFGAGSGAGRTAGMAGAAGAAAAGAHHNRDRDVADSGCDDKTAHLHKVFLVIHHCHYQQTGPEQGTACCPARELLASEHLFVD